MSVDKCPWCGAAATTMLIGRETVYECHSFGLERSRDCKFRESAMARIAELEAELSRLRDNPRTNDTCHKCKTSIRANDATVTEGGRKYHALCKVAERAEAAERERDSLQADNERVHALLLAAMDAITEGINRYSAAENEVERLRGENERLGIQITGLEIQMHGFQAALEFYEEDDDE